LNNTSSNKISLSGGIIYVTSSSFQWGGDTVATRTWVSSQIGGRNSTYIINEDSYNTTISFSNGML